MSRKPTRDALGYQRPPPRPSSQAGALALAALLHLGALGAAAAQSAYPRQSYPDPRPFVGQVDVAPRQARPPAGLRGPVRRPLPYGYGGPPPGYGPPPYGRPRPPYGVVAPYQPRPYAVPLPPPSYGGPHLRFHARPYPLGNAFGSPRPPVAGYAADPPDDGPMRRELAPALREVVPAPRLRAERGEAREEGRPAHRDNRVGPRNAAGEPVPREVVPAPHPRAERAAAREEGPLAHRDNRVGPRSTAAEPPPPAKVHAERATVPVLTSPRRPRDPPPRPAAPRLAAGATPTLADRAYEPSEVLVEFASLPSAQDRAEIARRYGLTFVRAVRLNTLGTVLSLWRLRDRRGVETVVRALQSDRRVASAQPNFVYRLLQADAAGAVEGRPVESPQYAARTLRLAEAHALSRGAHVVVAVIDSGIDATHPELAGSVIETKNVLPGAAGQPPRPHGHGTGMAGAVASHGRQIVGVAPEAKILAVRAFAVRPASGSSLEAMGTSETVALAIDWALERHARVLNLSFAGPKDAYQSRLFERANVLGTVLVAAAGNAGPRSPLLYPAADPRVLAVAATDQADRLYAASSRGRYIAVAAPGADVFVAAPGGGYDFQSGTSIAAAHVSGLVALLVSARPDLRPEEVRKALARTARDLGAPGPDEEFGAGLVDAAAALHDVTNGLGAARVSAEPQTTAATP